MKSDRNRASRRTSFLGLVALGAILAAPAQGQIFIRTIDGTWNNLFHPSWGSAGIDLVRLAPSDYGDGIQTPAGANRPSARAISNALCAQAASILNAAPVTDYLWQWGQFIDHDLDLTGSASPPEPFPIPVPLGDPFFDPLSTGTQVIPLHRSLHTANATIFHPREQLNEITAFLDASMVYGSDSARALALRRLDGTGKLKTSPGDLLPFNTMGLPNAPDPNDPSFFVAGDVRSNEQVGLTAMHTLFVREHNTLCDALGMLFPFFGEEIRYQFARALVGAEIQVITYKEFLPALLGPNALSPYTGYKFWMNPGVSNEFSTAAFRVGHTLLSPVLQRLAANGSSIPEGPLPLQGAFFNPSAILNQGGIEPLLRGLAAQPPQEVDPKIVDDVRNFLFGPPGAGGFDLASLNLQRGRDHGLPSYNGLRSQLGLSRAATFADISSDPAIQAALAAAYASPADVDAWVGGLAEDHVAGAVVGPLFFKVLKNQFERVRDGDRFWYKIYLFGPFKTFAEQQTLAKVIRRNTPIGNEIQDDVFELP